MNWLTKILNKGKPNIDLLLYRDMGTVTWWMDNPKELPKINKAFQQLLNSICDLNKKTFIAVTKETKKKYSIYRVYKNAERVMEIKILCDI